MKGIMLLLGLSHKSQWFVLLCPGWIIGKIICGSVFFAFYIMLCVYGDVLDVGKKKVIL